MRRHAYAALVTCAILTFPFGAEAQEVGRSYHYGVLSPFRCEGTPVNVAFRDEMHRRGFIKGQNVTVDCREFGSRSDLSAQYAAGLVEAQVDVIVVCGDVAIRGAQQATKAIPILAVTDDMSGVGYGRPRFGPL